MTRKLKALGLALVAVFAMSVVAAQGAQAAVPSIHYPNGQANGILTGTTEGLEEEFKVGTILGTQAVKCKTGHFQATAVEGAKEVTVHPTYTECTSFGEPATVTTNHCAYIFKEGETSAEGHAAVTVECEGEGTGTESTIEIADPGLGCTMKIGAQHETTKGVHYTNVEGHVTIKSTVGNIKIKEKVGSGCGFVTGNTGVYEGAVTVKAYVDNGNLGTPTTPNYQEGAEIPVEVLNP